MNEFNEIIEKIGDKEDFFFVQIGSHDGIGGGNDPLYEYIEKYNWSGILVEPVPYLYKELKKNYEGCGNLVFKNVAISCEGGTMKFYSIEKHSNPKNPFWYNQLGSFNKDVVLSHRQDIPEFDKYFKEEEIKTITFDSLVEGVNQIDLLHIDTEGYDLEIIKSIDFNKITPSMILYEHKHLENPMEAVDYLKNLGYGCYSMPTDTLAICESLRK
jgi:FkbM family methyltransferase